MNIIKEFNRLLKGNTKKPKCFSDENFLYCFCGKCKPRDYELPKDLQRLIAMEAVKNYKSTPPTKPKVG